MFRINITTTTEIIPLSMKNVRKSIAAKKVKIIYIKDSSVYPPYLIVDIFIKINLFGG